MKKLLCLFGTVGLSSSLSANVISCNKKEESWFILPSYPKTDADINKMALDLSTKITKYNADGLSAWTEKYATDDGKYKPSNVFQKNNDDYQKYYVESYLLIWGLGYIYGVYSGSTDSTFIYKDEADKEKGTIFATNQDDFETEHNNEIAADTTAETYITYFDKIVKWAEAYKK